MDPHSAGPAHDTGGTAPASAKASRSAGKGRRRFARLLLALAILLVAGRGILPFALEQIIPWAGLRYAGVRVEIGNIDLGLIRGRLKLDDLRVDAVDARDPDAAIDPSSALLGLERLETEIEWSDLLSRRVLLRELVLEAPTLKLVQAADGGFVLPVPPRTTADSSAAMEAQADAEIEAGAPAWEVGVDHFEVNSIDFSVRSESFDAEVLKFAAARFGLEDLWLASGGLRLGGVTLRDPSLHVERDWLLAQGGSPGEAAPAAEPSASEPIVVSADRIAIEGAGIGLQTPQGSLDLRFHFETRDFRTEAGNVFPIELEVELGDGRIHVEGGLGIDPLFFDGRVVWSDLAVPPFMLLRTQELLPWLRSCNAEGDLKVKLQTGAGAEPRGVTASGTAGISQLALVDPENGELSLGFEQFELSLRNFFGPLDPTADGPGQIDVERILMRAPSVVFTRPPEALARLREALGIEGDDEAAESSETPESTEAAASPGTEVRVAELEIRDAGLRFVDRTVSPTHETRVEDLSVVARGIDSRSSSIASLSAGALIQKTGSLELRGKLTAEEAELELDLRRLDLVSYDAFVRQTGWSVTQGEITLRSSVDRKGEGFRSSNAISVHDLRVDPVGEDWFAANFGLSLDLVLALLRDLKGDIELRIPLVWQKGELAAGFAAVVRDALKGALTGAITSPIKMAGALIPRQGGRAASFEDLPSEPGQSELDEDAARRLAPVAKLLKSRPALGLEVRGQTSAADRSGLALAILGERLEAGEDVVEVEDMGFLARRRIAEAVRERAAGGTAGLEPEDQERLQRWLDAQPVPPERFAALGTSRAEAARAALTKLGAPAPAVVVGAPEEAETPGISIELRARGSLDATAR